MKPLILIELPERVDFERVEEMKVDLKKYFGERYDILFYCGCKIKVFNNEVSYLMKIFFKIKTYVLTKRRRKNNP